jgi:hypothetical protein
MEKKRNNKERKKKRKRNLFRPGQGASSDMCRSDGLLMLKFRNTYWNFVFCFSHTFCHDKKSAVIICNAERIREHPVYKTLVFSHQTYSTLILI